jgi:transcription termination factor Rho
MTKAELEKKTLSDLHALAAEAGVERYRLLSRGELIERLSGGESEPSSSAPASRPQRRERPQRQRRDRPQRERPQRERAQREGAPEATPPGPAPEPTAAPREEALPPAADEAPSRPRRRRRRRRFGRRKEGVTLQDLLLPPEAGRQVVLCAETREACTALLRGVAADLAGDSKGPDPVALLIDPSPEELADWKREAPQAEIVAAGQARHASDALAQAATRAGKGEDVILLVDSLTRLAEAYGDPDSAKEFFDAGRVQATTGGGSLTVVAALERPSSS